MPKPIEKALIEARSPQTNPERLQALSEWKRRNERTQLRQAIAANPNSEEGLLLELAADYPNEVMANPRFQLLLLSDECWWEDVEPISMLRLLAYLGANAPEYARLDFFDQLGGLLADTDPLDMNMEWHMSFSQEFTVEWEACSGEEDNTGSEELDTEDAVGQSSPDHDEPEEQEFSIDFSCVVDEVNCNLTPPCNVEDPISCLEKLIDVNSEGELLSVLLRHGWEKEVISCGDGYWEIESVTPEIDGWELHADLNGVGSGSIQITDPSGETHVVDVEAPDDLGDEYLNPTLNEFPDLVESIFAIDVVSSSDLVELLRQVIANERESRADNANHSQSSGSR
jgi:hypothetical protein